MLLSSLLHFPLFQFLFSFSAALEGGPMEIVVSEREKDLLKVAAIVVGLSFLPAFLTNLYFFLLC